MSHLNTTKRLLALLLLSSMLASCDNADTSDNQAGRDAGFEDVLDDAQQDSASDDSASDGSSSGDSSLEDGSSDEDAPDSVDPVGAREARGELDITFAAAQPTPGLFVGPSELRSDPSALMLTPDSEVVIAGRGRLSGEAPSMFSMRLDEAGALDSGYGADGVQTLSLAPADRDFFVLAGAMQADGKSLICGNVRGDEMGDSQLFVARLNPDGSPDASFGDDPQMPGRAYFDIPADSPNSLCWALQVLPDEKILVGGQVAGNNTMTPVLMRLNADGALDTSFGSGGETPGVVLYEIEPDNSWLYAKIREIVLTEDDKILALIDSADLSTGHYNGYLLRYHLNGRIDESFGDDAEYPGLVTLQLPDDASHEVFDFAVDLDRAGRIFIGGQTQHVGEPSLSRFFVHALDASGAIDSDFAGDGTYILDDLPAAARAITLQPNGKIIAVGSAMTHSNETLQAGELLVVRLGPDGALDATFAPDASTPGVFVWEDPTHTFYAARAVLDALGRVTIVGSSPDDPTQSPRGHGFVLRVR